MSIIKFVIFDSYKKLMFHFHKNDILFHKILLIIFKSHKTNIQNLSKLLLCSWYSWYHSQARHIFVPFLKDLLLSITIQRICIKDNKSNTFVLYLEVAKWQFCEIGGFMKFTLRERWPARSLYVDIIPNTLFVVSIPETDHNCQR